MVPSPQDSELRAQIAALRSRRHNLRPADIETLATNAGWTHRHTKGSHKIYSKQGFWANLSVPQHRTLSGRLALGLLRIIEASLDEDGGDE